MFCSPQTFFPQHLAKLGVINHSGERINQCLGVEWIKKQTRIANDFGQAGLISRNYRHAALHGVAQRQAETFEKEPINERDCAAVERGEVYLRNIARKQNVPAATLPIGSIKSFAIKPTAFTCQDKLRKLTIWTSQAQAQIRFDQPHQVLPRLNGTKRWNVIPLDSIALANFFQFCLIFNGREVRWR